MTLGPVRVMGAGVVVMMCVEEVYKYQVIKRVIKIIVKYISNCILKNYYLIFKLNYLLNQLTD